MEVKISSEAARSICKLGMGEECCAFLMLSGTGWSCAKAVPQLNKLILKRLVDGTMVAKGEGDWEGCLWAENEKVKNNER